MLTREDMRAFRRADSVTFHSSWDGTHEIRLTLRKYGADRVYSASEQTLFPISEYNERTRSITPDSVDMFDHDGTSQSYSAFHSLIGSDRIMGLARALKAGQQISLKWIRNNNSENINSVGYHCDNLELVVRDENGKNRVSYLIGYSIGPDNSARMIRVR